MNMPGRTICYSHAVQCYVFTAVQKDVTRTLGRKFVEILPPVSVLTIAVDLTRSDDLNITDKTALDQRLICVLFDSFKPAKGVSFPLGSTTVPGMIGYLSRSVEPSNTAPSANSIVK